MVNEMHTCIYQQEIKLNFSINSLIISGFFILLAVRIPITINSQSDDKSHVADEEWALFNYQNLNFHKIFESCHPLYSTHRMTFFYCSCEF